MPTTERAVDRARRMARVDRNRTGAELRDARVAAGLSLGVVGSAVGLSASQVSRIERGLAPSVSAGQLALIGAAVGLDVRVRSYPGSDPLRDAAQQRVLDRLVGLIPRQCPVRREVTLGIDRDLRAWDARIEGLIDDAGTRRALEVEIETRVSDGQALLRRLTRKMQDAGITSLLLVVADTKTNRAAVSAMHVQGSVDFPISARLALAALAQGRHPGGSAIVFV